MKTSVSIRIKFNGYEKVARNYGVLLDALEVKFPVLDSADAIADADGFRLEIEWDNHRETLWLTDELAFDSEALSAFMLLCVDNEIEYFKELAK